MDLGRALSAVGAGDRAASFELFSRNIDRDWVEQALQATGSATVRRRKLPAEYVVWIVIGMGLLRDRSIQEVVRHLDLVLPDAKAPRNRGLVTGGAVVQARDRLGAQPMEELFTKTAQQWSASSAEKNRWRGLTVYGIDGSTLRIPDTEENEGVFGRPASGRGQAAYPQVKIVALLVLRTHLVANMELGGCRESELKLAEPLLDALPNSSLTILDRAYLSFYHLHRIQSQGTGRHWLTRMKTKVTVKKVKQLGPGDHLVELTATPQARKRPSETWCPGRTRAR